MSRHDNAVQSMRPCWIPLLVLEGAGVSPVAHVPPLLSPTLQLTLNDGENRLHVLIDPEGRTFVAISTAAYPVRFVYDNGSGASAAEGVLGGMLRCLAHNCPWPCATFPTRCACLCQLRLAHAPILDLAACPLFVSVASSEGRPQSACVRASYAATLTPSPALSLPIFLSHPSLPHTPLHSPAT